MITHEYAPFRGGVATYVAEMASAAQAAGYGVEVWTVAYRNRLNAEEQTTRGVTDSQRTFPVVRFTSSGRLTPVGLAQFAWGLFRRRRELRERPIVLMSVGAQMIFILFDRLGIIAAQRVTVFFYGSDLLRLGRRRFWRGLAQRFYARAAGFGVLTPAIEQLARTSGLLPSEAKIVQAPCALPSVFGGSPEAHEASDGVFRLLTVARLHPRKGQLEVARALALLPATLRSRVVYQVVGVGDSSYQRAVEIACQEGDVACEFLGAVGDAALSQVYRCATIYVQASMTLPESIEGFGISFLEASFHGCPVAAYRSGGVEAAVVDGETGLLVAEGDRVALAATVERLLNDAALRTKLSGAGARFARGFSWEWSAKTLCEAATTAPPRVD